uniref:Uncharacterized protein n=1 Tax=Rhizophora mucronata TaxID=61149 RepID=A0A2P2PD28_RHIMU
MAFKFKITTAHFTGKIPSKI